MTLWARTMLMDSAVAREDSVAVFVAVRFVIMPERFEIEMFA